jgi:hypothetical protein
MNWTLLAVKTVETMTFITRYSHQNSLTTGFNNILETTSFAYKIQASK